MWGVAPRPVGGLRGLPLPRSEVRLQPEDVLLARRKCSFVFINGRIIVCAVPRASVSGCLRGLTSWLMDKVI